MPVTDRNVAALRAQFKQDFDEFDRLADGFIGTPEDDGYSALITGGFLEAVDQRFGDDTTEEDVVAYVTNVRTRGGGMPDLDPVPAERILMRAVGFGDPRDLENISDGDMLGYQFVLMGALVADERYDDAGLEEFLAAARRAGDDLMAPGSH